MEIPKSIPLVISLNIKYKPNVIALKHPKISDKRFMFLPLSYLVKMNPYLILINFIEYHPFRLYLHYICQL